MLNFRFLGVTAVLLLASCANVEKEKIAAVPEFKTERGALSGTKQMIAGFYFVNGACASTGYPTLKVIKGPEHGKISIEQGVGAPNFSKDDGRSSCAAKTFPGTEMYYTSEAGFTGADSVSFERIGVTGDFARYQYTIQVR